MSDEDKPERPDARKQPTHPERPSQAAQLDRAEQPSQAEQPDRAEQPSQAEQPLRPKQAEQAEQPMGAERSDQAEQAEKPEQSGRSEKPRKKKRPFWVELPLLIGVALVLTIVLQTFFVRVFLIPSESMERTLHGCPGCYGDRILVDKVAYWFGEPTPGEVVVFERPATWTYAEIDGTRSDNAFVDWLQDMGSAFGLAEPSADDVVKRVIAVGGQTVECCDERNRVKVDGEPLTEPYLHWQSDRGDERQAEFGPVTVPPGMLFVLGDNRNNSGDSRTQGGGGVNGLVPVDNVIGKARAIILPPARWGGVGDDNPQVLSAPAWQAGIPAGIALAAAWPVLWLTRRVHRLRLSVPSGSD